MSDEIGVVEFIWVPACLGVRVSILVFLSLCLEKLIDPAVRIDEKKRWVWFMFVERVDDAIYVGYLQAWV